MWRRERAMSATDVSPREGVRVDHYHDRVNGIIEHLEVLAEMPREFADALHGLRFEVGTLYEMTEHDAAFDQLHSAVVAQARCLVEQGTDTCYTVSPEFVLADARAFRDLLDLAKRHNRDGSDDA
jgi:hypothetical protein